MLGGIARQSTARLTTAWPISRSDLRLERTFGHPPETASIIFDGDGSTLCATISLTAPSSGSISKTHRVKPSAFNSGFHSTSSELLGRCTESAMTGRGLEQPVWPQEDYGTDDRY